LVAPSCGSQQQGNQESQEGEAAEFHRHGPCPRAVVERLRCPGPGVESERQHRRPDDPGEVQQGEAGPQLRDRQQVERGLADGLNAVPAATSVRSMLSRGAFPSGSRTSKLRTPYRSTAAMGAPMSCATGLSICPIRVSATAATGKVAYLAKPNRERTGPMTQTAPIPPIASCAAIATASQKEGAIQP